jgi:hypothetical protein
VLLLQSANHYNLAQQPKRFMDRNSKRKSIQTPSCTEIKQNKRLKSTPQKDITKPLRRVEKLASSKHS